MLGHLQDPALLTGTSPTTADSQEDGLNLNLVTRYLSASLMEPFVDERIELPLPDMRRLY